MTTADAPISRRWTHVRRITAVGEPLLELHSQGDGRIEVAFGGDVANGLVCLARILRGREIDTALFTALGASSYGHWLRERLRHERIRVIEPPGVPGAEPGIYGVPLASEPGAAFSYWRQQSAARQFFQQATLREFEHHLGDPQLLLVTGITLALCSDDSFEALYEWAQRHRSRCGIIVDTNFRSSLWPTVALARTRIGRFCTLASFIATGLDDERALWDSEDPARILERLARGPVELLIRSGSAGCIVAAGAPPVRVPAVAATVVDTAGAGDSHLAGYLAARVHGSDPIAAARFANRVAAAIVGQRGSAAAPDTPLPDLDAEADQATPV